MVSITITMVNLTVFQQIRKDLVKVVPITKHIGSIVCLETIVED